MTGAETSLITSQQHRVPGLLGQESTSSRLRTFPQIINLHYKILLVPLLQPLVLLLSQEQTEIVRT